MRDFALARACFALLVAWKAPPKASSARAARMTTPCAMRFYAIKRRGLDVLYRDRDPQHQHIVLVDPVHPYTEEEHYSVDSSEIESRNDS